MSLPNDLEAAIYNTLAGGTALTSLLGGTTIYNGVIPRGGSLPAVVFSFVSGLEDYITPTDAQTYVYMVKGLATTQAAAGELAAAINTLLHKATLTIAGHTNFASKRVRIVRYGELDPALHSIAHAGGDYEFRIE